MKALKFITLAALMLLSCSKGKEYVEPAVTDPIQVQPSNGSDWKGTIGLSEAQKVYASGANEMAFRFLQTEYGRDKASSQIYSPLSLQIALSMAANGASGETLREIVGVIGFGADGIGALNEYNNILLKQLPALSPKVQFVMNNAFISNNAYPLSIEFQQTVSKTYYAAVESMDFSAPEMVAARVNDWTRRCTNGFIDKMLEPNEINSSTMALLMNAIYFKAPWVGGELMPLFLPENTVDDDFTLSNGGKVRLPMMRGVSTWLSYADRDGYELLAIPYVAQNFVFYIFLPKNGVEDVVNELARTPWRSVTANMDRNVRVHLGLPKFEIEQKISLKDCLNEMGISRAFGPMAEFDRMFLNSFNASLADVLQKSRIKITEWGTEAASVTVDKIMNGSSGDVIEYKEVYFEANRPFVFVLSEKNTEAILFEGIFTGR